MEGFPVKGLQSPKQSAFYHQRCRDYWFPGPFQQSWAGVPTKDKLVITTFRLVSALGVFKFLTGLCNRHSYRRPQHSLYPAMFHAQRVGAEWDPGEDFV